MIANRNDGYGTTREAYEWKTGAATIAGTAGTTNLNTVAAFADLFKTVPLAHRVKILSTGTAYIRLNKATNDVITITSTAPIDFDATQVYAIFASTNNSAVTLTVQLA
jgi:hypothetical protein